MNITMETKSIKHLGLIISKLKNFCNFFFSKLWIWIYFFCSGYHYAHDYYKKGGYLCPSDIYYGRPKRAVNTYGKWKVIVNLPGKQTADIFRNVNKQLTLFPDAYYAKGHGKGYEKYTQTQRLEQCM